MIKGEAHLIFRDVNTGEITKEHTQKNVITNFQFGQLANTGADDSDTGRFGRYVYIGGGGQETNRDHTYVFDQYAVGITEAGISQPRYLSGNVGDGGTFAYYYEYQQRFNPPASTRTITTIAIQRETESAGNLSYQRPLVAEAWLSLSSPCTQTPTETLDVFYRIIWNNPDPVASGINNSQMDIIARRAMNNDTGSFSDFQYEYPADDLGYLYQGQKMVPNIDGRRVTEAQLHGRVNGGSSVHTGYYTREMRTGLSLTDSLGRIYGSIAMCDSDEWGMASFPNPVLRDFSIDTPVGNIFPHSTAATGPFYQSTGVAVGDGTLTIDGSAWTNPDFNKFLQVEITNTGALGASEYKLTAMRTTGTLQNTYRQAEVSLPLMHSWHNYQGYSLFDIGSNSRTEWMGPHCMRYDQHPSMMIVFRENWIGKMDVMTGYESERHHSASSVPFIGTQINQLVTVPDNGNEGSLIPGDIWIADETTGLHRLHEDESAIEVFDITHTNLTGLTSSACRGVTFTPGRIWAAFDGGLVYTDDNGTSFTVYNGASTPTYTQTDHERVWFIQGDPQDANHHIGIAYNDEATLTTSRCDLRLLWWDPAVGFGNQVTSFLRHTSIGINYPWRRLDIFRAFECSPDDSVWGNVLCETNSHWPAMYTYNSTAPFVTFGNYSNATFNNRYHFGWFKDLSGNDMMLVPWHDWSNAYFGLHLQSGTSHRSDVYNSNTYPVDTAVRWWTRGGGEQGKCILPSGMWVGNTARNSNNGAYRFYYMIPAWYKSTDAFGGEGRNVICDSYGWNGAAWEKYHAGSKATHAAAEPAIEGLTIAFDDDSGAQTFVDTDFYTVPIVDGIIADGATEFNHKYNLYYKKAMFAESTIENSGVLTGTTVDFGHGMAGAERQSLNIIDVSAVTLQNTGTYLNANSGAWWCRFNHIHTNQAYLRFRMETGSGVHANGYTVGFADASKIGSATTATNVDFAFRIRPGILGGTNGLKVEVYSNGTLITVADDGGQGFQDNTLNGQSSGYGNLNRNNEDYVPLTLSRPLGSTDLEMYYRDTLVHTFTGVSNNLVASFYMGGNSNDLRLDNVSTTRTDTMMELGSPAWRDDPDFYAIDLTASGQPRADEVKLNGVPVTTLYINDRDVVLAAGEVSILSIGYVRYAAADVGKTLTIDRYNVLFHE